MQKQLFFPRGFINSAINLVSESKYKQKLTLGFA